jgi:hypothetical protein
VGIDAGAWCPYGNPSDLPPDQRRDDARSLTFDTEPLAEPLELLGRPELRLRVSADRPRAFVMARLCDVAPDGASTLITRGALNLCHRAGHDEAAELVPGELIDVTVSLKSVAYSVPAGHRLRVALSTSYWPWLWPSPEPVTIRVATGGAGTLRLPVREPRPEDGELPPLGPPETAPPLPVTVLRPRAPQLTVTEEVATGAVTYRMSRDFSAAFRLPSGLEYHDHDPCTFTITGDDPLSARVVCERRIVVQRGDWSTTVEVHAEMTADADDYRVSSTIHAFEGDTEVHSKTYSATIPRDHT